MRCPLTLLLCLVGLALPVSASPLPSSPRNCSPLEGQRVPAPSPETRTAAATEIPPPVPGADYRHLLSPTAYGWPRLDHWCVWVEPVEAEGPSLVWDRHWLKAVESALNQWEALLPIERVTEATAAQVKVHRRRPPLRLLQGEQRASHGRAELTVLEARRRGSWRLEPRVDVLISPGQRPLAIQATALHELGHAFGLWGHSDEPADAMAAVPGPDPVVKLTERDRATLRWLYHQPTLFGWDGS